MDQTIAIGVVIVVLIAGSFIWRRLRPEKWNQEKIVNDLLSDVRINQRLLVVMAEGEQIKYFCTTGWNIHKERIDFLSKGTRNAITEASALAEQYNEQTKPLKVFQAENYIPDIDIVTLNERLKQSRSGLEDWLLKTTGTIDPAGKKGGLFDMLLGR